MTNATENIDRAPNSTRVGPSRDPGVASALDVMQLVASVANEAPQPDSSTPPSARELAEFREIAHQVRGLSRINPVRSFLAIALDWGIIGGCLAAATAFPHVAVWGLLAVVIATRQHALLILMHDASHYRLCAARNWNDRLSNWLLARPLLVSTEGYRRNHSFHHRYLNTDRDPDWTRKTGKPEWTFPKTRRQLARLLVRDLCGGGFINAVKSIFDFASRSVEPREEFPVGLGPVPDDGRDGRHPPASPSSTPSESAGSARLTAAKRLCGPLVYYAIVAIAVYAAGLGWPVLSLWFIPAFTLLPVILRMRSIAEHFGVPGNHELNQSRNTHGSVWERFFLVPHHCGYHLDHHLFPSVPFYNLPALHELLCRDPGYALHAHQTARFVGGPGSSLISEISRGD